MENIVWIKDVIYLLPVAALIWKASQLSAKIKQNEKDIEILKGDLKDQNKQIIESLNNINATMAEIKTEVEVIKAYRKLEVEECSSKQGK